MNSEPRPLDDLTDHDMLVSIHNDIKYITNELGDLREQIHGNGQPGIKDRLAKVEEKLDGTKKLMFGFGGVLSIITIVGNSLVNLLKFT